ncbi:autophagy-related protein 18f-like [Andrographis paniculata]|uniref:autophagy-related protein 18f-like n=1 Tax=Andrographis paniculata TaxID=175694 RepID=UPI0021E90EBD|nr:autophagy-related protein 18f-like [Andrographis paniculata]
MSNDGQRSGGDGGAAAAPGRVSNGIIPSSFKAISSYLRIVSSGASNVASTVRSAASAASSAIVERDGEARHDQVSWAGFDRLELESGATRQVLLLGFNYGFQVWDVEEADNVCNLVSRHDGPVSFLQMLPKPIVSNQSADEFAESRPLLIICADGSFNGSTNAQEDSGIPGIGSVQQRLGTIHGSCVPTVVWFYSLRSHTYVHLLRFRSVVHLVRCSSRVIAILQSAQIHCLNPSTLAKEYTILTNPVPGGCYGSGDTGLGPLAVGPRWIAYSGGQVAVSNSGRLIPQHLTSSPSFPSQGSNGSLVAHYAKESSKQLAAGIVTLGEIGYKKLSRYYSERLPEGRKILPGTAYATGNGIANGHSSDSDSVGMVIVRDIVSRNVLAQFKAHKSPISSLCFDPSGLLLVTASVQGSNINVFCIMRGVFGDSEASASGPPYVHLYRLQRGLTNAVIRDISFSSDSEWVMVSSSRGTTHLFAISPSGGSVNFQSSDVTSHPRNSRLSSMAKPAVPRSSNSGIQVLSRQSICLSGPPVTLSPVRRIRNGSNGWINTVSGAAAATGLLNPLSGAIASAFHKCKDNEAYGDSSSMKINHHLLVFSPAGFVMQYALHTAPAFNGSTPSPVRSINNESNLDCDVIVEAIQKWNVCQKQNCRDRRDNIDVFGVDGNMNPERMRGHDTISDSFGTVNKEKITTEEKLHMYISEAEIQMHDNENPLWTRPEIYFQPMLANEFNIDDECTHGGEFEIESVPTRILEARSKNLVPVFDYLQTPKLQTGRISVIDQLHGSEDSKVACGTGSLSLDSFANFSIMENERDSSHEKTGQDGVEFAETSRGPVNTSLSPTVCAQSATVNTRGDSAGETQDSCVNNRDVLKTENWLTKSDDDDGSDD